MLNYTGNITTLTNATSVTQLLVFDNDITGGMFVWFLLIGVWGVLFLTYKNHPMQVSLQVASLGMFMTAAFFSVPGMTTWLHIGVSLMILTCSILYSFMAQQT